jgi:hypothetical protein
VIETVVMCEGPARGGSALAYVRYPHRARDEAVQSGSSP